MSNRVFWPIAGLLGLAIMAILVNSQSNAQRRPQPREDREPAQPIVRPGFMAAGRFVVAHATEKQIVILDTTTGQLYKATDKDFKKFSDLPKPGPIRLPIRERGREQPKERPARDSAKERPKEKGDRPKEKRERPKEREERKERNERKKDEDQKRGVTDLGKGEPATGKKDR